MPYIVRLAPEGWIKKQEEQVAVKEDDDNIDVERHGIKDGAKCSAWARLINKVYRINSLICEKCGSDMSIVAFILEPEQINRIMKYFLNNGRAPFCIFICHIINNIGFFSICVRTTRFKMSYISHQF